jgi:hypothetical protein
MQVIITKEYLHLEPIGIVLVFFFFAIIVIQFTAMLFHRLGTLSHILVSRSPTNNAQATSYSRIYFQTDF